MRKYRTQLLKPTGHSSAFEIVNLDDLSEYQILKLVEILQISLIVKVEYVNNLCFIEVNRPEPLKRTRYKENITKDKLNDALHNILGDNR